MKTCCPICQAKIDKTYFKDVYISPFNNTEYKLYQCYNCELEWWEPLKIIPEFYEDEVFGYYAIHKGMGKLGDNHKAFFRLFPKM